MKLEHSVHWKLKKKSRKDIADDLIEYAIRFSPVFRDKNWGDASNAVCHLPMGRTLKVVYRRMGDRFKIITAFWLD
ncbi:DUF4258 domain-containing protein [Candidatus Woesearchaeota archaeon]|nr:DUF4258 domain-containing protein [Candidatus Woesearchaeota archaeon]